MSAQDEVQEVTIALAGLGSLVQPIDPGRVAVKVDDLIPGARYDITIRRETIPIAALPLEGITIPGLRESTACEPLVAAIGTLNGAAREAEVPPAKAAVSTLVGQGGCTDPATLAAARAALAATTRSLAPISVGRSQRLIVTIARPKSETTAREAATWTVTLETEPRGEWLTAFGVSFAPDGDELFFTKSAGDNTFQITRQHDEPNLNLIPSVYFSWLSAKQRERNVAIGPTAGIGLSEDRPAFFGGVSFTINWNIAFVAALGVTSQQRLAGRYLEGQEVGENLSDDQLHQRVYRPSFSIGLTFRFGRNPFAEDQPAPAAAEPPAAAGAGGAATPTPPAAGAVPPTPGPAPVSGDTGTATTELAVRDPDIRLRFDAKGRPTDPAALTSLLDRVRATRATDLFVVSHGWWNDEATADCFYRRMLGGIQGSRPDYLTPDRFRPVYVSVYWPSALFPIEPDDCEPPAESTARRREAALSQPFSTEAVRLWAAGAFPDAAPRPGFAGEVARVTALFEKERTSSLGDAEADELATVLLAWRQASGEGPGTGEASELTVFSGSGVDMARSWRLRPEARQELSLPSIPKRWLNFANAFTFWTMKQRAGTVGSRGVYDVLRALQPLRQGGLRVHLVGHSFGGKLVTASLTGAGGAANRADSLVLLQGAFSQFAFASMDEIRNLGVSVDRNGLYADVLRAGLVTGPVVATRSTADLPNRLLYPAGVALVGDVTEAAGRAPRASRYGSLGANGILGPQALDLDLATGRLADLDSLPRAVNAEASGVILGHSDLVKPQVFRLIWDAVELGGT